MIFDNRPTLSRSAARSVYDAFAAVDHTGGKDVGSGYGGPAISSLLDMADFPTTAGRVCDDDNIDSSDAPPFTVLDYGCGQGKLAELVLSFSSASARRRIQWRGVDQSPLMVEAARERLRPFLASRNNNNASATVSIDLLESGNPTDVQSTVPRHSVQRFVSTYCLDLLSEDDMYSVLDVADHCLDPDDGLLLLAGITWGYRDSIRTALMTALWEVLYVVARRKVGGCRPQHLEPYLLHRGWKIVEKRRTMPTGFPWMMSEVISARPPSELN